MLNASKNGQGRKECLLNIVNDNRSFVENETILSTPQSHWLYYSRLLHYSGDTVDEVRGCSHTKPYYHPEIPDIERRESETEGVLRYRLLLLGDGGAPRPDEPVLKTLGEWAQKDAAKTSIVFLGDNMYPDGMTARKRHEAAERLVPQLSVVKDAGVHGLFIPGNHDWASGESEGYSALLAQEKFINDALAGEQNFLPSGGSPGPVALELPKANPVVRLIVLDTQWWIHQHEKPEKSPETVIAELITLLDTALPVIVLGHHPLQSYGPHGGYFDWKAHLFPTRALKEWLWIPIPVIGSVCIRMRGNTFTNSIKI